MLRRRWLCLAAVALLAGVTTGCTIYTPQSFFECSRIKTEFESNNFKVTKLGVQGTASVPFLFGLSFGNTTWGIILGKGNLHQRAMTDLLAQANLVGKCAYLHNINSEWTMNGVPGIYVDRRLTITADVVEFDAEYVDYRNRGQ